MAKVLLIGESWFTTTLHQKGFDSFQTSEYTEGGADFLAALEACGHETTYVPAHDIHRSLPETVDGYANFDVVVVSDIGANSFQVPPQTFGRSEPAPDKSELLRRYVAEGGGLLMIGGYMTFSGIEGKARWGRSPLGVALPVEVFDRDDRVEIPRGAEPKVVSDDPLVVGMAPTWPALLGLNELVPKPDSKVLVECASYPLLVTGTYEAGRTAAFASDIAPHWAPPPFLAWSGYPELWDRVVRWLSSAG